MLTLSRRTGESVIILLPDGRYITILVQQNIRGNARLGIDAPPEVKSPTHVHRPVHIVRAKYTQYEVCACGATRVLPIHAFSEGADAPWHTCNLCTHPGGEYRGSRR